MVDIRVYHGVISCSGWVIIHTALYAYVFDSIPKLLELRALWRKRQFLFSEIDVSPLGSISCGVGNPGDGASRSGRGRALAEGVEGLSLRRSGLQQADSRLA